MLEDSGYQGMRCALCRLSLDCRPGVTPDQTLIPGHENGDDEQNPGSEQAEGTKCPRQRRGASSTELEPCVWWRGDRSAVLAVVSVLRHRGGTHRAPRQIVVG
jgi:hypothetical protein